MKSNFTTRISNYLQNRERKLAERTGRSVNDISEEVTMLGLREIVKKHPEYSEYLADKDKG